MFYDASHESLEDFGFVIATERLGTRRDGCARDRQDVEILGCKQGGFSVKSTAIIMKMG